MHREGALDADPEADLADREGLADSITLAADDGPLEQLDTLAGALHHAHVHLEGVARGEIGNVVPEVAHVNEVSGVHDAHAPACGPGGNEGRGRDMAVVLDTAG